MKKASLFLLFVATQLFAQSATPSPRVFSDAELGIRFSPPLGLVDNTIADESWMEQRAARLHTAKVLKIRLSLRADLPDTAPEWCSVGIESYPRDRLGDLNDRDAVLKMSSWVAGLGRPSGQMTDRQVGPFRFAVSASELHEGSLTKRAHIYTTILKGQMFSVAFSANSPEVLARIEKSISTFAALEPR
jgi:hypothetical protein